LERKAIPRPDVLEFFRAGFRWAWGTIKSPYPTSGLKTNRRFERKGKDHPRTAKWAEKPKPGELKRGAGDVTKKPAQRGQITDAQKRIKVG